MVRDMKFRPYQIIKAHPLGTYVLAEPSGRVLRNLIYRNRLIQAYIDDPSQLYSEPLTLVGWPLIGAPRRCAGGDRRYRYGGGTVFGVGIDPTEDVG
ncbi:uncharacterized protein N7498_008925 [Penicillium cinerascens]|uniref:Uncharacterized protein n=1 Tax=Penicillium cinerascens TaxID=70096 RepID=A0A9W9MCR0_9EURO|nr:uncharacterized protein N7498_008925 [Penicillium cinerascens]KAJ5195487.1 hypothetical protein N7498_008925 [Penicillium cinerascens]